MSIPFPDTSFLCALYREQRFSKEADRFMTTCTRPLRISSLLLLEFKQSIRLQVRMKNQDRTKGFPVKEGDRMLRDMHLDLASGILVSSPVEWVEVHHITETLSSKYTQTTGNRLVDILHVATALHLGASEFLTFDARQRALAEAEGMTVPLPPLTR